MPASSGSVVTPSSTRPTFLASAQLAEDLPSLGRAHVRQRIGRILDVNGDFWWRLDRASDFEAVAAEVNTALVSKAIPWLGARDRLDQVLAATRRDASFIESWHLARLSVLAERNAQPELAAELRLLSQREADYVRASPTAPRA